MPPWAGPVSCPTTTNGCRCGCPPGRDPAVGSIRLSIEAEYRGWELTRVRLYTDGSRRVLLRRKKTALGGSAGAVIYTLLRRMFFLVDPERIHTFVFAALRAAPTSA